MISTDVKVESNSSSPISLSVAKEEPEVSFSDLLKGVKIPKKDKDIQNGLLAISFDSKEVITKDTKITSSKEMFLSLLKGNEELVSLEAKDTLELDPKITENLSAKEIKTLVADAKKFLKNKIINSDDYKRSEIKDLPKTLKGLVDMAKKFGVDISKITIEEVKVSVKPTELKEVSQKEIPKVEAKVEAKEVSQKEIPKVEAKILLTKTAQDIKTNDTLEDAKFNEDSKLDNKRVEINRDLKSTPLFKAQEKVEHTTEQLVQTKQFKIEEKTPKNKADETLKLLLRGEKPSQSNSNLTADFSVATAKVLAPNATTEVSKSLEQLLHGEKNDSSQNNVKLDGLTTSKADSFEVKLNEAKQMIKYISQDVKTAIEDYKSPFTRIKVQLNPQKLGEVDLTVVQRGKNLHVSISSNNAAINTLAMNANELRTQLANTGINNATLNFNNSSQSEQNNSQQQQNHQNERKADKEYNYFEGEETNEEILSSLEIVVPNYA